jgi:hypothetical protein
MPIIDPDDFEGLSDEDIERLTEGNPTEVNMTDRHLREEEPEEQFYDAYELPRGVKGDE